MSVNFNDKEKLLKEVSEKLKDRVLFPESNERVKNYLKNMGQNNFSSDMGQITSSPDNGALINTETLTPEQAASAAEFARVYIKTEPEAVVVAEPVLSTAYMNEATDHKIPTWLWVVIAATIEIGGYILHLI